MIDVQLIPTLKDNYTFLIRSTCGKIAILDPGEADPVIEVLENQNLTPNYILITHHHWDHVNGIPKIKKKYSCEVVVPYTEASKIKGVDIPLKDGDIFELGDEKAKIIATSGHTLGAICYYFEDSDALFTGDTLFSLGCGRLFEGTPEDMFASLEKLKAMPDNTLVYCGHEYTRLNAGFCLKNDPDNADLKKRIEEVKVLRAQDKPTIPSTIGLEKKTNTAFRAKSAEEFAIIRQKMDGS